MDEEPFKKRNGLKQRTDIGVQAYVYDKYNIQCDIPMWVVWILSMVIGIISMFIGTYSYLFIYGPRYHVSDQVMEDVGYQGVLLFRQYDRNGDGYLSLAEFEPIAHRMEDVNITFEYSDEIEDGDEVFTLQSSFEPLKLETMSKDNDSLFATSVDSLIGLKSWRVSVKPWHNFGVGQMKDFLPPNVMLEHSHEAYSLVHKIDIQGATLSSNRYYPPQLYGKGQVLIHRLLSMFHQRPFVYSRFAPAGSYAVVRASNDQYIDIVFRIHAEFQLNEPPIPPFWFTPAQFTGHLVMDKSGTKLLHFHLFVPNEKRLNVDMEWLNGPSETENMEVDIGYMERMELKSTAPSIHMYQKGKNIQNEFIPVQDSSMDLSNIKWDQEISFAEAARMLEVKFYPFKQVRYLNFSDIWPEAQKEQKPVHSILLWGALDDQSC